MADRLSGEALDRLFDAVVAADTTTGAEAPRLISALYRMLAFDGQPVTPARLATEVGWDVPHSQDLLNRLPNVEADDRGAVIGFGGLSLRPTAHQTVIAGRVRYAWCAWDTLFLPVALDTTIEVRSHCPRTGRSVRLTVAPTGVVDRTPADTALAFVHPDAVDTDDLRGSFCADVNFLAGPAATMHGRDHGAGLLVLDLDDAFELGRRMIVNRCGHCAPQRPQPGQEH